PATSRVPHRRPTADPRAMVSRRPVPARLRTRARRRPRPARHRPTARRRSGGDVVTTLGTRAAPPEREAAEPGFGLPPQLVKILGAIVAPTTLLTALLYYFGWSHAYWFCDYFGVNSTVLG